MLGRASALKDRAALARATVPSFVPTTEPYKCYRLSEQRLKALLGKASVALGRNSSYSVQVVDSSFAANLGSGG